MKLSLRNRSKVAGSVHGESKTLGRHLITLAWVAIRSFFGTILVLSLAGVVLASISYYWFREYPWTYGAIAAAVALLESLSVGIVLGVKRATVIAMAHGLGSLRLGQSLVRLVFERMIGITQEQPFGDRGGQVGRSLERLPLAQAQQLLERAVENASGDQESRGWLRSLLRNRMLKAVQSLTLARFRDESTRHGGVDLIKVKEELESTVDEALVRKVRKGMRFWTVVALLGLPALVAVQIQIVLMLLRT